MTIRRRRSLPGKCAHNPPCSIETPGPDQASPPDLPGRVPTLLRSGAFQRTPPAPYSLRGLPSQQGINVLRDTSAKTLRSCNHVSRQTASLLSSSSISNRLKPLQAFRPPQARDGAAQADILLSGASGACPREEWLHIGFEYIANERPTTTTPSLANGESDV